MALFGKKKGPEEAGSATDPAQPDLSTVFSPQKAASFFQHAQTVHDTENYEYAIQLWLNGLRADPGSKQGLEGFFKSAEMYLQRNAGKKSISKAIVKGVSGKGDIDRFLAALLEWGLSPDDVSLAVRALEATAKLGLTESAVRIGEIAMRRTLQEKKVRKDLLAKISAAFERVGSYERAVVAAEQAYKVDPTDGELSARIRMLAAQATMAKGGYETAGQEGGFRANVRDADKQRMLEEGERIVKTEQTIDRLINQADQELAARPLDLPTIEKLAKLLMERGRAADEERAHAIYTKGYRETRQFRFREFAGDIRIRQKKREVADLRRMMEEAGDDDMVKRMHDQAAADLLKLELDEFGLRVEHYPTDLFRKFELGRRCLAAGQTERAIELFQEAQHDPKNRAASMSYLGQAFALQGWNDEAIETFRAALEIRDLTQDQNMEMRYYLMVSLQKRGEELKDLAAAEEAEKLAASIAVQQIGYRDIRARRDAVKKLAADLRGRTA